MHARVKLNKEMTKNDVLSVTQYFQGELINCGIWFRIIISLTLSFDSRYMQQMLR